MNDRPEAQLPEDPTGIEEPHDVLAAEEFAMPTRSAGDIPPDPTGIQEPHDVLAAEEFAMPTGGGRARAGGFDPRTLLPAMVLAAMLLLLLLRRGRAERLTPRPAAQGKSSPSSPKTKIAVTGQLPAASITGSRRGAVGIDHQRLVLAVELEDLGRRVHAVARADAKAAVDLDADAVLRRELVGHEAGETDRPWA